MWFNIAKAFLMGGFICFLGQLVINWTHLTNGKILVMFLILGAIMQGFGLYLLKEVHIFSILSTENL